MDELTYAYCGFCRRWHYFGYDEIGAPITLLACWQGTPPKKGDRVDKPSEEQT